MELYQKKFETLQAGRGGEPAWLAALRRKAMTDFETQGFPTLKDEAWRYTDITPSRDHVLESAPDAARPDPKTLEEFRRNAGRYCVFVVDGEFSAEHSSLPGGITVLGLEDAARALPELVEPYLDRCGSAGADAFHRLNTAFFRSGVFFHVPEAVTLKEPVHIVFVTSGSGVHVRNLFVIGAGSRASLIETHVSLGARTSFSNVVTEMVLERGAILDHVKTQNEGREAFHFGTTYALQRHASSLTSFAFSIGGRLARQDTRVVLDEEGASCELNGLCLGDEEQLLDFQTRVDHRKPEGTSHQFFKGLWAGRARGVFRGQVFVHQDAQKTDAHQTNKNLLLSETAKVDTQPQLEILADDVKCSHGAAVGQLQEDALFYLRSRGIGEKEAGHMLAQGFAREVIGRLDSEPLQRVLLDLVDQKLSQPG